MAVGPTRAELVNDTAASASAEAVSPTLTILPQGGAPPGDARLEVGGRVVSLIPRPGAGTVRATFYTRSKPSIFLALFIVA